MPMQTHYSPRIFANVCHPGALLTIRFMAIMIAISLLPHLSTAQLQFGSGDEPQRLGPALDTIVAVVEDDVITRRELHTQIATVTQELQQRGAAPPTPDQLERQVLERMILVRLQQRAAERSGVVVDDPTLNAALETIARQNNLTLSELRTEIERDGSSFNQFREDIRHELLATRLRQRVIDSQVQVTEQEIESVLNNLVATGRADQEYRMAQILIALPEGATPAQIDEARRKAEGVLQQLRQGTDFQRLAMLVSEDRQALEGGDLGWRSADQLPTLFADLIPKFQVGQISDLIRSPSGFHIVKLLDRRGGTTTVRQMRLRHILIKTDQKVSDAQAQQRLRNLAQQIRQGGDFALLARAHSQDPRSKDRGGDLGWISEGDLDPALARIVNQLQLNELSEPTKTPQGWHLMQVVERRMSQVDREAQYARVREALFRRRVEEQWETWLQQLRQQAFVEIRLSQSATTQTPDGFTQSGS